MARVLWRAESSLALFLVLLLPYCESQPCTDYDLRLVGGGVPNQGRVEICVDQQWGTVCDHSWDNSDARVVCRQLGYVAEDALAYLGYYHLFGIGSGAFLLDDIHCNGLETRLINCNYDNMTSDCSYYYNEAGLNCNALLQAPQEVSIFGVDDNSIFVSWSSPATQTHGTSIQNYSVTCSNMGQLEVVYSNFSNYSRQGLVDGLQPCSHYNCCVSAFSVAGEGRQMCDTGRTVANAPKAPRNIWGYPKNSTSLFLSWDHSQNDSYHLNGCITRYHIYCLELESRTELDNYTVSIERHTTFHLLHPYYTYSCTVAAIATGEGHGSSPTTIRTFSALPSSAPQNIDASVISSSAVFIHWNQLPQRDQNGIISNYVITVTNTRTVTVFLISTQNFYEVKSLRPYTNYTFAVAAENMNGTGPFSKNETVQTYEDVPSSAPQSIDASVISSSAVLIHWSKLPQQDQNGIISNYVITVTNTRTLSLTVFLNPTEINQNFYEVKFLRPYTNYTFAVAAENINGTGPFSKNETVQTYEDVPSAPPENLNITAVATTSVDLAWHPPPLESHNGIIIGYVVMINGTNGQEFRDVSSGTTEVTVDSLSPKSVYCFSVAAATSVGPGLFSDTITQETDREPGSGTVIAVAVSVSSITICIAVAVTCFVGYKKFKRSRTNAITISEDDSVSEILTMKPVSIHLDQHVDIDLQEKQGNNLYENFPLSLKASDNKENSTPALQDSDSFTEHEQPPPVPKHGVTSQQSSTNLTSSTTLDCHVHKASHVQQMTVPPEETEQSFTKDKQLPHVPKHGVKNQQTLLNSTPIMRNHTASLDRHTHMTLHQMAVPPEETEQSFTKDKQLPPVPKHGVKNQQTLLNSTQIMRNHTASLDCHTHMKLHQMAVPPEETEQSVAKRKQPLLVPKHSRKQLRSNSTSTGRSLATSLDSHSGITPVIPPKETKNEQPPSVPKHGIKDQQQLPNPTQTMESLTTSLDCRHHRSLPRMAVFPKEKKRRDKQPPPGPKSEEVFPNQSLTDEQSTPDSTPTLGNFTFSLDHHIHKTLERMTATQESDHSCLKDEPASPDPPTTKAFTLSFDPHVHKILEQMAVSQETEDRLTRELPPPVPDRTQHYNETANNSMKHRLLRSLRRDRKKPKQDPTAAPQTVTFTVDQHLHSTLQQIAAIQNHTDTEGTDTVPGRHRTQHYNEAVTFTVDQHLHSTLQQIAAIQNRTDTEGTDTGVHGEELPPSAPRSKSTDQDVMPTVVQDGNQNKQMSNVDSENPYQPLLPYRLYAQPQENNDYQQIIHK